MIQDRASLIRTGHRQSPSRHSSGCRDSPAGIASPRELPVPSISLECDLHGKQIAYRNPIEIRCSLSNILLVYWLSQSARYHSGYGQITSNTESLFEPSSAHRVITYRSLVAIAFAKLMPSAVNKCATIGDLYLSVERIAIKLRRIFAPIKPMCSRAQSRKLLPDVVADACP